MPVMATRAFPVVLLAGEDGWVVAECPVIPGCISQGRSREEAIANIEEAIRLCLDTQSGEGWSPPTHYELVDVQVEAR